MARISQDSSLTAKPIEESLDGQTVRLIYSLIDSLSEAARASLLRDLAAKIDETVNTPTGVLATVLKFLPKGSTVTVAQLRQQVADRGVEAEPKHIYNAIGYLSRTGALTRLGYGRYKIDGVEFSTSDNLGGEPDRHEDLSDD